MAFKVDGAAGEAVVGVDVVYDDEIKAVKVRLPFLQCDVCPI
jgi:hypothetical protein